MHRFRRHLYRERRRLALFTTLVTLAAFLIFSDDLGMEFGVRYAAFAAIGTGVGAGLIALGLLMITPGWRQSLETVSISTLLYAMAIIQVPDLSFHEDRHSLVAFVGFLVAAAVIHIGLYGRWSDRLLRLPTHVERATAITRLPRKAIWDAAFPSPANEATYWDRTARRIVADPEDADGVIISHRFENGMMLDQKIHFEQVNPGKSFRYSYQIIGGRPRGIQACVVMFEGRDDCLALHLRWERSGYPVRLALMHWVDDWGGRALDAQLDRLEEATRARGTTGRGKLATASA